MTAQSVFHLPTHPTMRHPHTGFPLRAVGMVAGRPVWPIMGASPDDGGGQGGQGGSGGGDGGQAGSGGSGSGAGSSGSGSGGDGGGQRTNATDAQGNDLGYPKDTPTNEMSDKEQAAYWKNNSRRHENRYKDLVGDRKAEDLKRDLDAYAEIQKQQQTPAEQALAEAREKGKTEGITAERNKAATAIFRGALEAGGVPADDIEELVGAFNVAAYVNDNGIDTTKITNFAKKFGPSDRDTTTRRRDFGAGTRRSDGSSSKYARPDASDTGGQGTQKSTTTSPSRRWGR